MRLPRSSSAVLSAAVSGLLVAAVMTPTASAVAADAADGADGIARSTPFVGSATVRLVTGDLVRVRTRADGSVVPTVLPGSPHADRPAVRWGAFVLPKTAPSVLRRLDLSLFDVSALQGYADRVPVVVRFVPGASTHRLPGVRLDTSSARVTPRGLVAHGSYGRDFPGFSARDLAEVASVRLDTPDGAAEARPTLDRAATHQVTVRVTNGTALPEEGVVVTLMNLEDGDLFQASTNRRGAARFDVPAGAYSALGFSFQHVVIAPEFDVSSDLEVLLNTGAATVKPAVTLPGHRVVDTALSIARTPETGFTFPFVFSGPHFFVRVQPTTGDVLRGGLHTGVSATLVPRGASGRAPERLAISADIESGVPDDLTFDHRHRDFATVVQRLFANGPAGPRESFFGVSGSIPNG